MTKNVLPAIQTTNNSSRLERILDIGRRAGSSSRRIWIVSISPMLNATSSTRTDRKELPVDNRAH